VIENSSPASQWSACSGSTPPTRDREYFLASSMSSARSLGRFYPRLREAGERGDGLNGSVHLLLCVEAPIEKRTPA
jgi:hypothetical protein